MSHYNKNALTDPKFLKCGDVLVTKLFPHFNHISNKASIVFFFTTKHSLIER